MSNTNIGNSNGTYGVAGSQGGTITVGNGNDTVVVAGGSGQAVTVGNGNDSLTVSGATGDNVTIGNGNDTVTVSGGSGNTVVAGNGNDAVTVTGSGNTVVAGNGNDTVTVSGGSGNTVVAGNGNDTIVASADHNDTITVGNGNDTIDLGANDTVTIGKGNDILVVPSSTATLSAPVSLTVLEDHSLGMGIISALSADGFGQEKIYGFATNDKLQVTTSQFANFTTLLADAKQVGQNTVITADASDAITLENFQLSNLKSSNVVFTSGGSSAAVSLTIAGLPTGATLSSAADPSGVSFNAATNIWTVASGALADLTLHAGEVTSATLLVTATDSATGSSISQSIALTVNPVAPTLTAPTSLSVTSGHTVALGISETPFDVHDVVSLKITGIPTGATLSAGTHNSDGSWTLTPAQLSGLTLTAGAAATTHLTVTATNTLGITASTTDTIALTITSPVTIGVTVQGIAQEGQSLSAVVTGAGGLTLAYQWQNSTDGVHWNNIASATGTTYTARESDENDEIRVQVTPTGGSTVTSAATAAVLDAPPTVTKPIVNGIAQEGQTLTASASAGQSDNPVTYAWYSSADGFTNAVATGATYQVKQGDEGFTIEAKATVTNDNGITISAASAPTASVIDNATIAVAVSIVGGGTMQEGQSLLAQATITGDPSDLGAPVTYQWQSSSNGGLTWTNVAATAIGTFNGIVSSLYQLAEGDEGKTFRALASFTDDTGQVVSTSSAATVAVADVTPVITVPFSYAADDLSIVKNGTQIYNDTFSQAPPASPTILTNGVPTPIAYVTLGGTWTESNGKAIFSSSGAAPNPAVAGGVEDFAELNTNTDPTSTLGLKLASAFTVSSTFDLVAPTSGSYGMELNDGTPTHGVDQLERLIVARVNGASVVELVQANLTTNTQTVLASQTLTNTQLAGNNQIEFQFNHAANAQTVSGSFELIDNGVVTSTVNFAPTASIFTNGVDWTRVDIGAFTSPGVGLNVAPGQAIAAGEKLTASAAANDADATINYQWEKSSSAAFTSFTNIGTNSANYVVQAADAGSFIRVVASTSDPDNTQSATATSQVTGAVNLPSAAPDFIVATQDNLGQDSTSPVNGNVLSNDTGAITGDQLSVTAVNGSSAKVGSAVVGTYGTLLLNANGIYSYQLADSQANVEGLSFGHTVTDTFTYTATDSFGTSTSSTLNIVINPANDVPVIVGSGTTANGSVIESPANVPETTHTISGTVAFTDQNLLDTHVASIFVPAPGNHGDMSVTLNTDSTGGATGSATWTYTVSDASLDPLAQGQTATDTFDVLIADPNGGIAQQPVTITLTGSNDTPVVQTPSQSLVFTQGNASVFTASGTSSFTDADVTDTHTVSTALQSATVSDGTALPTGLATTLASALSATLQNDDSASTPGQYGWNFSLNDSAVDFLTQGEVLDLTYQVDTRDPFGGVAIQNINVAITGVNAPAPTVTTPVITGTAQEGQTLTASASSGAGGQAVGYAWYSSADSFTNLIATGATYLVQEGDEGFTLEAKATVTNGQGVSVSATSAATAPVLDAAPTITTPIVTGVAQEGQTLTVSASAGQSDNPVTYAWYSSADGFTNAIATGATYQVKQADEGFTLEGKATVTNDNGVTISAASAPTASVIDNATIAVAVTVLGGGTVQQGQSLLAQATITGDPSDLGAAVTYQWQSSSDGGLTWANVAATAAGSFGAGLSSLYQLTEADEGKTFRALASFTDDTGQVVSASSTATVAVADVTPVITIPFSYAADDLSIIKNGTQIYNDTFSQAPPASPTILSNGVPTPVAYLTLGGTWTEANGKAIFSSSGAAQNPAVAGGVEDFAELNTNTDPTSNLGLKLAAGFTVSSTFDLTAPTSGSYGMELNDGTSTHGIDQLERLIVANVNGNSVVELVQTNLVIDTQNILASQTLTSAQLAGNTQIEFQFAHTANAQIVSGSFELIDNGSITSTVNFAPTAAIFTNGVDWTRAEIGAFTTPGVGLNVAPGQSIAAGQTLTASAAANDADATINYQWEESSSATFTSFTNIGTNSANYAVQAADAGSFIRVVATTSDPDNTQSATATSQVTAVVDAAPTVTTPVITGTVQEGQTLTASASSGAGGQAVSYAWYSSADNFTNPIATGATYLVKEGDEGFDLEAKATVTNDNGVSITATSAATAPVLDAQPTVTTPVITGTAQEGQTLSVSASAGQADNTLSYTWYSSADNFTNAIATGATYLVKEGDEGFDLEAKATVTNDNGVSITATSAATAPVLDAPPAVTTPVITGIAQEGRTLSVSASSGQADNPVTYAWYSSADNFTNAIATGTTYLVKQADENFTIEAKATVTNDNGVSVSATSAPTSSVIDNASVSVTVSVLGNGAVQEGQILVASGTVTGDAADLTAPISYQWQSSADGGLTWTNVTATTTANINNVVSSLYQLGEGDEGKLLRAVASITDDTGQVVSGASAPTVTVADVPAVLSVPFSYAADDFKVVKGGTVALDDNFSNGPPPVAGVFSGTPVAFATNSSTGAGTWTEANGKAIMSSSGAIPGGNGALVQAILVTNTQPEGTAAGQSNGGLKENATFKVSATFDLAAPPLGGGGYGIMLTNTAPGAPGNEVVELEVQRATSGAANIVLLQVNQATGASTVLANQVLTLPQMAANTQIELDLAHNTIDATTITGSFELLNNGTQTAATTFVPTTQAHAFTNQTFTRAEMFATSAAAALVSGTAQAGRTLTAQVSANDADAVLAYQWQQSTDNGVSWSNIAAATGSTYVVREADVNDVLRVTVSSHDDDGTGASVVSTATAKVIDAAPTVTTPIISGIAQEGQTLSASATAGVPDEPVTYTWFSSQSGFTTQIGTGATYAVKEADENNVIEVTATVTNGSGATASATSAHTSAVLDAPPTVTTPTITGIPQEGQILTASAGVGDPDNMLAYTWYSSADNYTNAIGFGSTYTVQESDESLVSTTPDGLLTVVVQRAIEVKATATNDNGVSVSAFSAPTGPVLDAAPTVTTPTITGVAQEGQFLNAFASAGQSDNPVTYAWFSSTGAQLGTGASYLVQESDEGTTITVRATATNEDGLKVSQTSAPTAVVLDALPQFAAFPVISGTWEEGQSLTVSAAPVDSDNTVSYAWYSSVDNFTNPIATGDSYKLQESDEAHEIQVVASITNDNGVTIGSASNPTGGILDAPPSVDTPEVAGIAQAGFVLHAAQSAAQDADAAPVVYLWYSSADGYITPIGVGTSYLVQKADEGFSIGVKAIALSDYNAITNDGVVISDLATVAIIADGNSNSPNPNGAVVDGHQYFNVNNSNIVPVTDATIVGNNNMITPGGATVTLSPSVGNIVAGDAQNIIASYASFGLTGNGDTISGSWDTINAAPNTTVNLDGVSDVINGDGVAVNVSHAFVALTGAGDQVAGTQDMVSLAGTNGTVNGDTQLVFLAPNLTVNLTGSNDVISGPSNDTINLQDGANLIVANGGTNVTVNGNNLTINGQVNGLVLTGSNDTVEGFSSIVDLPDGSGVTLKNVGGFTTIAGNNEVINAPDPTPMVLTGSGDIVNGDNVLVETPNGGSVTLNGNNDQAYGSNELLYVDNKSISLGSLDGGPLTGVTIVGSNDQITLPVQTPTTQTSLTVQGNDDLLFGSGEAITIADGVSVKYIVTSGTTVTFGGSTGTLQLGGPGSFDPSQHNSVVGFSGQDHIDIGGLVYDPITTNANFSENGAGTGGTLTVSNTGGASASLLLFGDYTTANFALASDGHGGTLVTDPRAPQQPQLAPSHA